MVIYHFPCLENKWCSFQVVPVENVRLQRNVCTSSQFFFAVGMSQTDFLVRFLHTYLGYQSHAFAAVLFSLKWDEIHNRTCHSWVLFTVCSFSATVNQPVWPCIREFKIPLGRRPWKVNLRSFNLYRDYSNSFTLSNVSELVLSRIAKNHIQVQKEKQNLVVVCLRPP